MHIFKQIRSCALFVVSTVALVGFAETPFIHTQQPWPISTTSVALNGMIAPNGLTTTAWFEWGTNGNYDQITSPASVGNSYGVTRVSVIVSNLPPQQTFRCRLVASNSLGLFYPTPAIFTTGNRVTQWGDTGNGLSPIPGNASNIVAIAAGYIQTVALNATGDIIAWGSAYSGQTDVPLGLSNVVAVSAGVHHTVALKRDGTVVAWGGNDYGQTNVPAGLSNVIAIATGDYHSLALKDDGTIVGWGRNEYGQATVPLGLSNVVALAAGGYFNTVLKADGTVYSWGENGNGQTNTPVGLTNVVAVAAGFSHNLAVRADGTAIAWGSQSSVPFISGSVVAVDAGVYHSMALTDDGTITVWGPDPYGNTNVPVGLSNAVAIAAGLYHSVALANLKPQAVGQHLSSVAGRDLTITLSGIDPNSDRLAFRITALPAAGSLYQWTPTGRGAPILSPDTIVEDPAGRVIHAQSVITNISFSFIADDGLQESSPATVLVDVHPAWLFTQRAEPAGIKSALLCGTVLSAAPAAVWFDWGAVGGYDQSTAITATTGDGTLTRVETLLTNLIEQTDYQCRIVSSNSFGVSYGAPVFFTTGRRVFGWGSNSNGQTNAPADLTNAVVIAAGEANSLAVSADGTVTGWGWSSYGQATPPAGLSNVVDLASGYFHSLALRSDKSVFAWGNNVYGQTNVPPGLSNVVDVSAGYFHSLALKADGTLSAWGNAPGIDQTTIPAGLDGVVAIAAGHFHDLALRVDGTVQAWGDSTVVPAGLMDVISLAAGYDHSLALKSDGTVVAWGRNDVGQATVPTGLTNVVAIAAHGLQSMALRSDGRVVAWGQGGNIKATNLVSGVTKCVALAAGSNHGLALCNFAPQAQNQTVSGLLGDDLTIVLSASDPDGDPLRYRVMNLPASGTLYQFTPGGRGSVITPNTLVEDPGGRIIYAQPTSVKVTFTFVANDGAADSNPATVTASVISAPVVNATNLVLNTNGVFSFSFNGDTNGSYRIWASTNLTSWTPLAVVSRPQDQTSIYSFTDRTSTNLPQRFYRVTSP
jgi:alpha-tubulin suppressor-like RCC1 family protein